MKKSKQDIIVILSMVLMLGIVGCTPVDKEKSSSVIEKSTNKDSHYPITIKTYNYKKEPVQLTFNKSPEKVVAIYQNSIETMLALGLEDKIISVSGLDHDVKDEYKEAFSKVKYVEDFTPSKESIIMEQPDFILGWYSLFDEKILGDIDYWNKNNINTYMSLNSGVKDERTIENEINDILNLGKIFNVEEKAQALVDEINNKLDKVSKSVEGKSNETTLIVEFTDDQMNTYGSKQLAGDMVNRLGVELLNPEGKDINAEDLIKLNPDSIFVVYMDRLDENVPKQEINKILENKALASLDAVKNKRVYAIPLGEMYSSGIRTIDGINTFSKGLYPDLKN
ncbi:MAG: ABC transporter substrate-binding protein [Romboutsia sp.]